MFKYMSENVAPIFAQSLKVRFTAPFDLNDPFEFRPFMDFEGTAEEVRPLVDAKLDAMFGSPDTALAYMAQQQSTDPNYPKTIVPIEVFRELVAKNSALGQQFMAEMKKHRTALLAKERMAVQWEVQWEKFRQTLGHALGIFSLTEDPANVLMWSHYASQHLGLVVEFDEKHPWFDHRGSSSDDIRHLVQVSYVQNPKPKTWKRVSGTDMLYTKAAEWSYEREWRIIRFDVPPEAVRRMIFGARTTQALEKEIRALVAANPKLKHVAFKRARLLGSGKLEIVDAT